MVVDLNGTQDAFLPLTLHLPDGEQRRRTAKDEMEMRDIYRRGYGCSRSSKYI